MLADDFMKHFISFQHNKYIETPTNHDLVIVGFLFKKGAVTLKFDVSLSSFTQYKFSL